MCKFAECFSSFTDFVLPDGWPVLSGKNTASDLSAHMSSLSDEASRFDSCVDLSNTDSACNGVLSQTPGEQLDVPTIDGFMHQAYGESLLFSAGPYSHSPRYSHWATSLIMLAIFILCPVYCWVTVY